MSEVVTSDSYVDLGNEYYVAVSDIIKHFGFSAFLDGLVTIPLKFPIGGVGHKIVNVPLPPSLIDRYRNGIHSISYLYRMGLKKFDAFKQVPLQKAVFVTKPIPTPGQVGEVMLDASTLHPNILISGAATERASSIEFSVTNNTNPQAEGDWLPILPMSENEVIGERLFIGDDQGWAKLRFSADTTQPITAYRRDQDRVEVYDVVMPSSANLGTTDKVQIDKEVAGRGGIFTIDYTPVGDPHRVVPPLVGEVILSAAGRGAGERFTSVGPSRTLVLGNIPFIDFPQVANSVYNPTQGMEPYQPISVTVGGVPAINLTNYSGGVQTSLFDARLDPNAIYFIHQEDVLIFNQTVSSSLHAHYQYLPPTLRARVILRSNNPTDLVTPEGDWFSLICKIIRSGKGVLSGVGLGTTTDPSGGVSPETTEGASANIIVTGGNDT